MGPYKDPEGTNTNQKTTLRYASCLKSPWGDFLFKWISMNDTEYPSTTHISCFKGLHLKRKSPHVDLKHGNISQTLHYITLLYHIISYDITLLVITLHNQILRLVMFSNIIIIIIIIILSLLRSPRRSIHIGNLFSQFRNPNHKNNAFRQTSDFHYTIGFV